MSLENEGMVMPVQPMGNYGNNFGYPVAYPMFNNGSFGNGWGDDSGAWWILILLFALGGWGNNGFGNGNNANAIWPYFTAQNTDTLVQGGFNQSATTTQLGNIHDSITSGFANAEVANCNRAMDAMQTAYNNQIAALNRSFDSQTAIDNRLDTLDMTLQKCCCDNQLATVQTQGIVQSEAAANRFADANNTRDIITNATANTQAILDKLCQLELDGVRSQLDAERRENATLQNQLNMAASRADNVAQTARLLADNAAQTQQIENYVRPQINPAYIVPNPYAYNFPYFGWNNNGCGCNNGSF